MSKVLGYTIKLISDAEPGSGTGSEVVNDIVTRDHRGFPVLRATHLKGLLRQQLDDILDVRGWLDDKALEDWCFGCGGNDAPSGALVFSDATTAQSEVRTISRTRLNGLGTAADTSLRTTEAVSSGTEFRGTIRIMTGAPSAVETAIRLALLSLFAIGGGRSRGSGACLVSIDGETRTHGLLLAELDKVMQAGLPAREPIPSISMSPVKDPERMVTLALTFTAEQPVCCPELPIGASNEIDTGIAIPASAVLGAIISRLAQKDEQLATRALASICTRAWPLLPCALSGCEPLGSPVHVALSHRMSKLPDDQDKYVFKDGAVEPYDWKTASPKAPLKGTDGVLLRDREGSVRLWKSGTMPRMISAHNVVNRSQERTLFTVTSMAPLVYQGWLTLPEWAASVLRDSLAADSSVSFGKSRTVRGLGRLSVMDDERLPGWDSLTFVLQSPAAMPDDWNTEEETAEALLVRLVEASGFGSVAKKAGGKGVIDVVSLAQCGVRFGWNRHGIGLGVNETRRLQARRVFLPGCVFKLSGPVADLQAFLVRGLGVMLSDGDVDGRVQGFGAVLPHPGCAKSAYPSEAESGVEFETLTSDAAARMALAWVKAAGSSKPSASQISAVAQHLAHKDHGKGRALEYLKQQQSRPDRVWQSWKNVIDDVENAIRDKPVVALKALRIWQDIAVSSKNEEN